MLTDHTALRSGVDALLQRAEATPTGPWQIAEEEHRLMVAIADLFEVELPISAFRSAAGAAQFLRLARAALDSAGDGQDLARDKSAANSDSESGD